MKLKFIILLLLIGCSKINSSNKENCGDHGEFDFMYIYVPCEECVVTIEEILDSNPNIFDYNMVRNKENHIIIYYCYNHKETNVLFIEKSIIDMGLSINQNTGAQKIKSNVLCCTSQ